MKRTYCGKIRAKHKLTNKVKYFNSIGDVTPDFAVVSICGAQKKKILWMNNKENKMEIKKLKSIVTHIKSIIEREVKTVNNNIIKQVVLITEDGKFSNFASVWEKQNIDVKTLSENDPVEIKYTTSVNPKTKYEYKNFMFVSVVSPTADEQVSDESILAEITNGIKDL